MKQPSKDQLTFPILADLQPRGDGTYTLKPRVMDSDLDTWVSPKEAAKILGIKPRSIYYLLDEFEPFLVSQRPLSRKIIVSIKSIQSYKRATADPAFWTTPALKTAYITAVRAQIATLCND